MCYLRVYQKSVMDDVGELVGGCTGQFTKAEMHVREAAIKTGLEIALKVLPYSSTACVCNVFAHLASLAVGSERTVR